MAAGSNVYGRQVILPLTNKSGGGVIAGDVVVIDTTNNDAFTTSTAGGVTITVGVAQETIANNNTGRVLVSGYAALVNVNASVTRGNYGKTHTVAKQATDAGASRVAGTFCQFLTGGTTPDAMVYPVDLAGAALTNPMTTADDMIIGGASGAPARLAIGSNGTRLEVVSGVPTWNAAGTPVRATAPATDLSTSSGTPVAISSSMDVTVTVGQSGILVMNGALVLRMGAVTADCSIQASVDGGTTKFDVGRQGWDGVADRKTVMIGYNFTGLSSGSKTLKLYWFTSGSNTVNLDGASRGSAQLGSWVMATPL